jgi:hypothetical protein
MFSRLVLGITEAPFYPGAIYLISLFYTRKETATRLAVFYTGNLLASTFSGLIAAGVFAGLDGVHGLAGWRWLFLVQGVVTGKLRLLGHQRRHITDNFASRSCHRRFLHPSRHTTHDPLAHRGGAPAGPRSHCTRHDREALRTHKHLFRSMGCRARLPNLGLHSHGQLASIRQWL